MARLDGGRALLPVGFLVFARRQAGQDFPSSGHRQDVIPDRKQRFLPLANVVKGRHFQPPASDPPPRTLINSGVMTQPFLQEWDLKDKRDLKDK